MSGKDLQTGAGKEGALSQKEDFGDRPHPIEVRRALRRWALDKPQHVKDQVWTICAQMYACQRVTHPAARRIAERAIEANVKRLATG